MHHYDYSFLQALPFPQGLSSLTAAIRQKSALLARQLKQSTAREKKALARRGPTSAACLPELGFAGYSQALKEAAGFLEGASLEAEDILRIYRLLLPELPLPDKEARRALGLILSAYKTAKQEGTDPLLLIPCAALDLICLSPFLTGSHSTALLMAQAMLRQSGFEACQQLHLERTICRFYFYYEPALAQSSKYWAENGNDYLPYLEAFLSLLYLAFADAQAALPAPKLSKKEQIELFVLGSTTPVSKAQIGAALPNVSLTTIEAVLGAMVKAGSVQRLGLGRATHYLRA